MFSAEKTLSVSHTHTKKKVQGYHLKTWKMFIRFSHMEIIRNLNKSCFNGLVRPETRIIREEWMKVKMKINVDDSSLFRALSLRCWWLPEEVRWLNYWETLLPSPYFFFFLYSEQPSDRVLECLFPGTGRFVKLLNMMNICSLYCLIAWGRIRKRIIKSSIRLKVQGNWWYLSDFLGGFLCYFCKFPL